MLQHAHATSYQQATRERVVGAGRKGKWAMGDAQARAGEVWFLCWKNYRLALSSQHLFVSCDFLSPNSVKFYSAVSTPMKLPFFLHEERVGLGRKTHATLQEYVSTRAPLVLRFILTVLHPRECPGKHRRTHSQSVSSCIGNT